MFNVGVLIISFEMGGCTISVSIDFGGVFNLILKNMKWTWVELVQQFLGPYNSLKNGWRSMFFDSLELIWPNIHSKFTFLFWFLSILQQIL